jgi:tetratricopeptide (TPR) repeat protein
VVAVLAAAAFLPGLFGDFVAWDDDRNFLDNPAYRGLGPAQLGWMFTTFHMGLYQPLTWLTLGLDYFVWGMDPRGYHLTSLVLHAASAALVWLLARRLLGRALPALPGEALRAGAVAAALGFALHPLRAESVVWITERRDVVSGLFFLLAVLAWLSAVEAPVPAPGGSPWRRPASWTALALFGAALLSKPIVATLPALLLVLDAYPLRRLGGRAGWSPRRVAGRVLEKAPFLALAAGAGALTVLAQREAGSLVSLEEMGLPERVAIALHAPAFYLGKALWPVGLSPLYEVPWPMDPLSPAFLLGGAATLGVTLLVAVLARRLPAVAAAWAAFLVAILPVAGFAQNGPQLAADRYTYLATLPWAFLLGGAAAWCVERWTARAPGRGLAGAALVAGAGALVLLAGLSARQALVWHDSITLWAHAVAVDPASPRARTGLGTALLRAGRVDEALPQLREAVRVAPLLPDALGTLALALTLRGQAAEALPYARQAVALRPRDAGLAYHLGETLRQVGQREAALGALRTSARLDPGHPSSHYAIAGLLAETGRTVEAQDALAEAERRYRALRPGDPHVHRLAARVWAHVDQAGAVAAWRRFAAAVEALPAPGPVERAYLAEARSAIAEWERRAGRGEGHR